MDTGIAIAACCGSLQIMGLMCESPPYLGQEAAGRDWVGATQGVLGPRQA